VQRAGVTDVLKLLSGVRLKREDLGEGILLGCVTEGDRKEREKLKLGAPGLCDEARDGRTRGRGCRSLCASTPKRGEGRQPRPRI